MCLRAKPPPLPPADQSEMEGKSREMGWKVGGGERVDVVVIVIAFLTRVWWASLT